MLAINEPESVAVVARWLYSRNLSNELLPPDCYPLLQTALKASGFAVMPNPPLRDFCSKVNIAIGFLLQEEADL